MSDELLQEDDFDRINYERRLGRVEANLNVRLHNIRPRNGGIIAMIADSTEINDEVRLLEKIQRDLNVEVDRVEYIEYSTLSTNIETSADLRSEEGIQEGIFNSVFRSFGYKREGWKLKRDPAVPKSFEDFINSLQGVEEVPTNIRQHIEKLDEEPKLIYLSLPKFERIKDPLIVFEGLRKIFEAYPNKFDTNNPYRDVLVVRLRPDLIKYALQNYSKRECEQFLGLLRGYKVVLPNAEDVINGKVNL